MAKIGLKGLEVGGILADLSKKEGWALCVGAGISRPLFPTWPELVGRLAEEVEGDGKGAELAAWLLERYSPDAAIQAARSMLGHSVTEFTRILTDKLYQDVRGQLQDEEFQIFCDVLSAGRPASLTERHWKQFLRIARELAGQSTAFSLAELVSEIHGTTKEPLAVLSFNAEPLLLAITNALESERFFAKGRPTPEAGDRKMIFDYVTHSVSRRRLDRIPFIFLHGLLEVPDPAGGNKRVKSSDKLVFSEDSYLQLANNAFSWQSSVFLEAASSHHLVFIGVSLSDPNMRRWLAWSHANREAELSELFGVAESTSHYWVQADPGDEQRRLWLESLVGHLGVRVVWVDGWSEAVPAIRRMLSL